MGVGDREAVPVLLATAYGFSILFSYYILRPVRDEISAADRGNLQVIWTVVFLVMLVAVPAYSAIVARWPRVVFIPFANRFFAFNLLLFFAALRWLPVSARPWIDRAFYVWSSVFALFVVAVFWGFIADLFRNEQGKRLFGFIAVGSSLGAMAGSSLTATLAERVPVFTLLLIAIVPLEASCWLARALHRWSTREGVPLRAEPAASVGGTAFSGIGAVFRSPYLTRIALYLMLMTFASTILYFTQAELLGSAIADRAERRAFLARIDLYVNILTLVGQLFLASWIMRRLGMGVALATLPVMALASFVGLGLSSLLTLLVVAQVGCASLRHGISKPAREVLFTVVGREERYKSKAFIDAAVYRGGDLVSGWAYAGLAALGMAAGTIALAAAPLAAIWVGLALWLGRDEGRLRQTRTE